MCAARIRKRWFGLLVFAAAVSFAARLPAGTPVNWLLDTSGSWSTASNWSSNPALPGPSNDVLIDPPGGTTITVTHSQGNDTVHSLLCDENLVLSGGSLSVSAASQVTGSLTVGAGALLAASGSAAGLAASGTTIIDGSSLAAIGGGQMNLSAATSYVYPGTTAFASPSFTASGTNAILNLSGLTTLKGPTGSFAQLTITATSGGYVDLHNLPAYTTGTVQVLASGTNSVVNLSGITSFSASNAQNGPAANGNSSTGVTVSAGTLLVNGSLSAGTVAVQANAMLSLNGTLDWQLNSLKDDQSGTPGVDFNQVLLSGGNLTGANLILSLAFPGSTSPDDGSPFWNQNHTWSVVENTGTGSEALSSLTIAGYGTNGAGAEGSFSTSVGNGPGGDLLLQWASTVPEPSSLALLAAGAVTLSGCAWRRRRQARPATSLARNEEPTVSNSDGWDSEEDGPAILAFPSRNVRSARRAA